MLGVCRIYRQQKSATDVSAKNCALLYGCAAQTEARSVGYDQTKSVIASVMLYSNRIIRYFANTKRVGSIDEGMHVGIHTNNTNCA